MANDNIDFDEDGNFTPQKIKIKIKHEEHIKELIEKLKEGKKFNAKNKNMK